MKKSLKQLEDLKGEPQYFDEYLNVEHSLKARDLSVLAVSPVRIEGFLLYESHSVVAQFKCTLDITLPSSRSLQPVQVPMELEVRERYVPEAYLGKELPESANEEIVIPLEDDWIDLQPAVEDTILLSIPLRVLSKEEMEQDSMPSGQDWNVVSEEQFRLQKQLQKEQTVDPRLASLQSFFDQDETEE